ncbi:MAG: sensor histidine kinase [Bryobacteraceae bacterium]
MLPHLWQRLFRAVRTALGASCLLTELVNSHFAFTWNEVFFAAFTVYALVSLCWKGLEDTGYLLLALALDMLFFFLSLTSSAPHGYWISAVFYTYLLLVSVVLHDWWKALIVTAASIAFLNFVQPAHMAVLLPGVFSAGILGSVLGFEHRFLQDRASSASRQSVLHRYDSERARESERQRIAADFHDGPLQSFIAFQMRLEVIRKLLARDPARAVEELEQLRQLSKTQVNELRTFVRSMRPIEVEGSLNAAIRRVVEQFQKDSGIPASFVSAELLDPTEPEVSVEVLQIVREALYNIQKHAAATRVGVTIQRFDDSFELLIEDNGRGFPFSGRYSLEELEVLRLGPNSIKRRVRTLGAELMLDSKPGKGAGLCIRL